MVKTKLQKYTCKDMLGTLSKTFAHSPVRCLPMQYWSHTNCMWLKTQWYRYVLQNAVMLDHKCGVQCVVCTHACHMPLHCTDMFGDHCVRTTEYINMKITMHQLHYSIPNSESYCARNARCAQTRYTCVFNTDGPREHKAMCCM